MHNKAEFQADQFFYVGGRRADIPALGRQHVRSAWLQYTQHKNRNRDPVTLNAEGALAGWTR
jgi:hypothetical protein